MMTNYYTNTRIPGSLFRDDNGVHSSYSPVSSKWESTDRILKYFMGQDNEMEPITPAEAQKLQPEAFVPVSAAH